MSSLSVDQRVRTASRQVAGMRQWAFRRKAAGRALPRLGAVVGLLCMVFLAPPALARDVPPSFADLAERLLPAVVNISTVQQVTADRRQRDFPQAPPGSSLEEFFREFLERQGRGGQNSQPRRITSLGSGFIIDAEGYVVTNNHVIAQADEVTVILHDDTSLKATVVGKDTKTDLALLKIDTKGLNKPLATVKFGDSDKARVGEWVMAIGNPFGLGGSVTVGILSARARELSGPYDDFLQTDASINKGNSGGPMFNMDGEVIGINTAIYSPSGGSVGIGFAVPSNLAKLVTDQLREFGRTKRGWLGVRIQSVDEDMAKSMNLDKPTGAFVADVTPGGPADEAKIQQRDIILSFDGKDITEMRKLPRVVAETKVGSTVDVVVWRGDRRLTLKVKVGELDETETAAAGPETDGKRGGREDNTGTVEAFGLSLTALTAELRDRFNIAESTKGVLVTRVADNSVAAEKGIRPGDVIVDINQNEVKTPDDVNKRVKEARDAKKRSVLLLVDRQGDLRFVALRIDG